jgi:hypothetical protein
MLVVEVSRHSAEFRVRFRTAAPPRAEFHCDATYVATRSANASRHSGRARFRVATMQPTTAVGKIVERSDKGERKQRCVVGSARGSQSERYLDADYDGRAREIHGD